MEEEPEHMNLNKSSFLKELFIERPWTNIQFLNLLIILI
jgi:hypothetical protein